MAVVNTLDPRHASLCKICSDGNVNVVRVHAAGGVTVCVAAVLSASRGASCSPRSVVAAAAAAVVG
jgi:hypothetical protein